LANKPIVDLYNKSKKNEKYTSNVFLYHEHLNRNCSVGPAVKQRIAEMEQTAIGYDNGIQPQYTKAEDKSLIDLVINLSVFGGFTSRYSNI
jgi:hypothetical protein